MRAIDNFRNNISQVKHLHYVHQTVDGLLTDAVDLSDVLRSEIVLSVSAFDHFIHEVVRIGLLEIHNGNRTPSKKSSSFPVPLGGVWEALGDPTSEEWLDEAIRAENGWRTFQNPDQIKSVIKLIDDKELWPEVGSKIGMDAWDIKTELKTIVERRNKIAHEADLRPMSVHEKFPISEKDARHVIEFHEKTGEAIHQVLDM